MSIVFQPIIRTVNSVICRVSRFDRIHFFKRTTTTQMKRRQHHSSIVNVKDPAVIIRAIETGFDIQNSAPCFIFLARLRDRSKSIISGFKAVRIKNRIIESFFDIQLIASKVILRKSLSLMRRYEE